MNTHVESDVPGNHSDTGEVRQNLDIDFLDAQLPGISNSCCPSPDTMLRYSDGKLRRRKAGEVRAHLERCSSCAELAGLMGFPAVGRAPADLPATARKHDRNLVARRLGFTGKKTLVHKLLELADSLWEVRAPILVPVGSTALLLFLLMPTSPPLAKREAPPLVYQFTEISRFISFDNTYRSASGNGTECQAAAGSLIILKHHSERSDLAAGDPVSLTIDDGPEERVLLATAADGGLIEVPLVIYRPGNYRIRICLGDSDELLADLQCTITAPDPATSRTRSDIPQHVHQ